MKQNRTLPILAILLLVSSHAACLTKSNRAMSAPPAPTPRPRPLIGYLNEGNLWTIDIDGGNQRLMAAAPEGETIQDFVWALDGSRIYFSIGLQLFEVVIATGNIAAAGALTAPPGVTIDRHELARDGRTMIIHALDADAANRTYAVTIGQRESRELGIDEYNAVIQQRSPIIRVVGDTSVSPDGARILFKDLVGAGEELFISDVETGARLQLTNLYELGGFEESVETEGGRRVIEAAWSPDGRYVIFNPMQSCSETGLCYGRLFLVESWGGPQLQLSLEMMINLPLDWTADSKHLAYDDGSRIVIADTTGNPKALAQGNHPKWQPVL
ncbi:MAG: TolB family protein [Blastocatellia bacterium]